VLPSINNPVAVRDSTASMVNIATSLVGFTAIASLSVQERMSQETGRVEVVEHVDVGVGGDKSERDRDTLTVLSSMTETREFGINTSLRLMKSHGNVNDHGNENDTGRDDGQDNSNEDYRQLSFTDTMLTNTTNTADAIGPSSEVQSQSTLIEWMKTEDGLASMLFHMFRPPPTSTSGEAEDSQTDVDFDIPPPFGAVEELIMSPRP